MAADLSADRPAERPAGRPGPEPTEAALRGGQQDRGQSGREQQGSEQQDRETPEPTVPTVTPVPVNVRRIVQAALGCWLLALIACSIGWATGGSVTPVWTCVAGIALGVLGYGIMLRHRALGRTV